MLGDMEDRVRKRYHVYSAFVPIVFLPRPRCCHGSGCLCVKRSCFLESVNHGTHKMNFCVHTHREGPWLHRMVVAFVRNSTKHDLILQTHCYNLGLQ